MSKLSTPGSLYFFLKRLRASEKRIAGLSASRPLSDTVATSAVKQMDPPSTSRKPMSGRGPSIALASYSIWPTRLSAKRSAVSHSNPRAEVLRRSSSRASFRRGSTGRCAASASNIRCKLRRENIAIHRSSKIVLPCDHSRLCLLARKRLQHAHLFLRPPLLPRRSATNAPPSGRRRAEPELRGPCQ
jgi:hypothetical protein